MSSGVEFDEDKISYGKPRVTGSSVPGMAHMQGFSTAEQRGMAGWLMKKGWAKSPATAQTILIVIVVLNAILTFIIINYFIL